jgi:hypothetical protein
MVAHGLTIGSPVLYVKLIVELLRQVPEAPYNNATFRGLLRITPPVGAE